ncbi:MAG: DUF115 domain-containing protein [Leptolyngbyaceae cyanobacterium RM2_2_4]|nr:DUF115 domain-containing protein [Leptolyngbyaceae cyanobacterium SM1_4_3]NJO52852.1 DUF115 domain-containing protein [Leptolyngbyaceae cyanobacterium RM2_2_4]
MNSFPNPSTKPFENPILVQNPTINPYRHAVHELWNRIRWDLQPDSWRSRQKLKALKNRYLGQKAVILCNGPSLLKSDLSLLKEIYTFGLNKINLLFQYSEFRPSCIVAVNPFVIEQNAEFYRHTKIPLFLDSKAVKWVRSRSNTTYLHSANQFKFPNDCSISIFQGATVTFVALQIAYHLGFEQVALIGCDHNFVTEGAANQTVTSGEKDPNHFDPNYFAGGVKWQLPDLFRSEVSYRLAQESFLANGRAIFNATEGGHLELFPRLTLAEFLKM